MTTPSDKQTDNQPSLQPPDRLSRIHQRYSGVANEHGNYEVSANDLAWLIQEVELSRARVRDGGVATVDMYAPSSKREALRLLDAIEQSIRGLSQPLGAMETATRIKLSAEYGLTYVAALRERLSTDYAATAPIAPQDEQPLEFRTTKAAMLYAQRNNIPVVIPVGPSQSPAIRTAEDPQDELVDEVQHRMDQVVEAAVEWHQAGREGGEWLEAADKLARAIDSLLQLRSHESHKSETCEIELSEKPKSP